MNVSAWSCPLFLAGWQFLSLIPILDFIVANSIWDVFKVLQKDLFVILHRIPGPRVLYSEGENLFHWAVK